MVKRFVASLCFSIIFINLTYAESERDFLAEIDSAFAHYRESVSYLRTGNVDLSAIELDEMSVKWTKILDKYADSPPEIFVGNPLFKSTLTQTGTTITDALSLIDGGDPKAARERLLPLRAQISRLRAASGLFTLADCILEASTAMDNLFVYKGNAPHAGDWPKRADVVGKAAIYGDILKRCDRMAPAVVRDHPEFRRLFDGAMASTARIPEAIGGNDGGLLLRLLIELRSFDRLMFYRFG